MVTQVFCRICHLLSKEPEFFSTYWDGKGGGRAENQGRRLFHIRVRTVLVYFVCSGRTLHLKFFGNAKSFMAMSGHIRQSVREQADTGYWKSLLPWFSALVLAGTEKKSRLLRNWLFFSFESLQEFFGLLVYAYAV